MVQPDEFFRSGRGTAGGIPERASASKIGERMVAQGLTRCAASPQHGDPAQSRLWPLLCCELGLTYEQEEKVRQQQKRLLSNSNAWAERQRLAIVTLQVWCARLLLLTTTTTTNTSYSYYYKCEDYDCEC